MSQHIIEEDAGSFKKPIYTEDDKKIAVEFLISNNLLIPDAKKYFRFGVLVCPNEMVVMVYRKYPTDAIVSGLKKIFKKSHDEFKILNDREPVSKYGIEFNGKLMGYNLNRPNELPTHIDATNYHAFKAVYMKENKIGNVKEK